jgi:hypothetical protein
LSGLASFLIPREGAKDAKDVLPENGGQAPSLVERPTSLRLRAFA